MMGCRGLRASEYLINKSNILIQAKPLAAPGLQGPQCRKVLRELPPPCGAEASWLFGRLAFLRELLHCPCLRVAIVYPEIV